MRRAALAPSERIVASYHDKRMALEMPKEADNSIEFGVWFTQMDMSSPGFTAISRSTGFWITREKMENSRSIDPAEYNQEHLPRLKKLPHTLGLCEHLGHGDRPGSRRLAGEFFNGEFHCCWCRERSCPAA